MLRDGMYVGWCQEGSGTWAAQGGEAVHLLVFHKWALQNLASVFQMIFLYLRSIYNQTSIYREI